MTRVEPDGPCPCDLAVVGESPGEEELREGRGFVGRSGKVLWGGDDLIGSVVGRSRDTVWVTNVCKIPLPEPEWLRLNALERSSHIGELYSELSEVSPKLVLAFGSRASKALIPGFDMISKENGKARWVDDRIVMPLWHPAAYLRGNSKVFGELASALANVPDLLENGIRLDEPPEGPKTTDEYLEIAFPKKIGFLELEKVKELKCVACGTKAECGRYKGPSMAWSLCLRHALICENWAHANMDELRAHDTLAEQQARQARIDKVDAKLRADICGDK